MSAHEDEVRAQVKVVEDKEVELCIAHLRFLSKFYITVIENKRAQMNMAHTQFLANKEDYSAYSEWTGARLKIIDLYMYWLRELLNISIVDDLRALCMHQMMAADCYWFLAKMHQPTFHFGHSNYEMACRCMVKILNALFDLLPQHNKFVIHLVRKYSLIVLDYRKEVGLSSPRDQSSWHTSTHMHGRDLEMGVTCELRDCERVNKSELLKAHNFFRKVALQKRKTLLEPAFKDAPTDIQLVFESQQEQQQPSSQTGSRDWEDGKKEKKKLEPHVMELNEKEKLIAEGARRDKDDYPTFGDIISDWDTKDEALAKRKTEKTEEDSADDKSKKDIQSLEEKSALETSLMSEKRTAKMHEENLMISDKKSAKEYEETEEPTKREALHLEEVRRRPTLSKRISKEGVSKLEAEDIRKLAAELFGKRLEDEEEMPVVPEDDAKFKEKEEKGRADARQTRKELDEEQKKKKLRESRKDKVDVQEKKEMIDSEPKLDTSKKEASGLRDIPDSVIRDFGILEKRQKKPKRLSVHQKMTEPTGKKSAEKQKKESIRPSPPTPASKMSWPKVFDSSKLSSSSSRCGQKKSSIIKLIKVPAKILEEKRRKLKERASKGSGSGEKKPAKAAHNVGKKLKRKQKAPHLC